MAVVWKYVTAGTLGGIFFGASFLGIANKISSRKEKNFEDNSLNDNDEIRNSNSREELDALAIFHSDAKTSEPAQSSPFTLSNTIFACGVLGAFLAIGNIRFYQMWRARHSNNRFDADAFQRGFDRFMNEKAYETQGGD
jgi:hypothetical protein